MTRRARVLVQGGVATLALLVTLAAPLQAGGPLITSSSGQPGVWPQESTIGYQIDPGALGRFSNAIATGWVQDSFREWSASPGARLTFADRGMMTRDIDHRNALAFFTNELPGSGLTSILFDSDGRMLDALLGQGAGTTVMGIAGLDLTPALLEEGRAETGWVILSGRAIRPFRPDFARGVVLHEVGHTLGLDHSQIHADAVWDGRAENGEISPQMSYYWGPNTPAHLARDDRAWVAALYPSDTFAATTGRIHGRVLLPDGVTPVQGMNVIARRVGDEEATVVAGISGFRYKADAGWGSRDTAEWGVFELPGLPPGSYHLSVEPLLEQPLMQPRRGVYPGGRRVWQEQPGTDPLLPTPIVVEAGQSVTGRDLLLPGRVAATTEIEEAEPNDDRERATTINGSAVVTGRAESGSPGTLPQSLPDGRTDAIQDWFRLKLKQPSLVTAVLTAEEADADLNLYLLGRGATSSRFVALARSIDGGTPPETVQTWLPAGDYYLGVSVPGASGPETAYTLRVVTAETPEESVPVGPAFQALLVGDVTETSARVTWNTDRAATSTLLVGPNGPYPYFNAEWGSPTLALSHAHSIANLTPATPHFLAINGRDSEGRLGAPAILSIIYLPPLTLSGFATASTVAGTDPPLLQAEPVTLNEDLAHPGDRLLMLRIRNRGGPASDARIEEVVPNEGWTLPAMPVGPVALGALGTRAEGLAVFRLRPIPGVARAAAGVTLSGSYALPDGTRRTFRR